MSSLLGKEQSEDKQNFTRRALLVGAAQGGVIALLGTRLGWLQIAQGSHYTMLSEKNRVDFKMIAPPRGEIFDRHGQILALNQQNFRILITPEQAGSPQVALEKIQTLIGLSDEEVSTALERLKKVAQFTSVEIKDQLSWEDMAKIEVHINDLPGVSTNIGTLREYPLKEATAHVVGYVGAPTEQDVARDRVFTLPGFRVGKTGVERRYDEALRGKSGLAQMEVNVTGREVHELHREPEQPGETLRLTLDARLQAYVQDRLTSEVSGSAVVIDAQNGAIYAMASHPSFDPNYFVKGMPQAVWDNLLSMQGYPLTNKAIGGLYPPASTFKMVTALAGLQSGVINRNTHVYCGGHYDYKGQRFHCWKPQGHGSLDVVQALAQSCDTYFYEIAARIDIDEIAKMARLLGFEEDFSSIMSEARAGIVPDKNWKMGHVGQSWRPGDTIVTSIGQGALQSTPLQIAVMTARLASKGKKVQPFLRIEPPAEADVSQSQTTERLDINPDHLALVLAGMDAAVNDKHGTAHGSRIMDSAYAMGGKTGTAQVKRITLEQRAAGVQNEDLPWKQRHHALFTGYAPLDKPRYVCCVVIEHGVGGSRTAAPIARDILAKVQDIRPEVHKQAERHSP